LPTMFNSCFGVRIRLRGQKRVPRPPARITACVVSLSFTVSRSIKYSFCDSRFGVVFNL
jgi:hypothetical protein